MVKGRVFISYRREDTGGYAMALYGRLFEQFPDCVFKDIASIEPGLLWEDAIAKALDSCDAMIALIGREWLTTKDESGQRRLDNPKDTLRREIATALKRNVRVIATLVGGAKVPSPDELPADLQPLTRRQALEIVDEYWEDGVKKLITAIGHALNLPVAAETAAPEVREVPPAAASQPFAAPPAPQLMPAGLAELLPGAWQIQIANPLTGIFGQMTLAMLPQGMFRGQIMGPMGMSAIQGQWWATPFNQLQMQGMESNPLLGVVPYQAMIQFAEIGPGRLAGATNAGEQVVWQKVG